MITDTLEQEGRFDWPSLAALDPLDLVEQSIGNWRSAIDPGEPVMGKPRWSVTHEEGVLLMLLSAGQRVLEIGTGLGVSTLYLAASAQQVVTVDIDPWVHEHVWPCLVAHERILALETLPPPSERFDLVFIDGLHTTVAVRADIEASLARLALRGRLLFHDFNHAPIRVAVQEAGLEVLMVYRTANQIGVVWPWAI